MSNYATVNYATSPPQVDIPRNYNASVDLIDRNLERGLANKTALIDNDGCYTCAELAERMKRAGNALQKAGAEMETRVMLCLLDDVDFPSVFLAAIRTGVIAIPVNTLLTSNDYDYMLRDSRARILVVSDTLLEKFEPILAGQPHLKTVVVAGTQSTGHQHLQTLMAQATACADVVVFSAAKDFFAYGLGNSLTFPLYAGATAVVLRDRPTPDAIMNVVHQHEPTIYYGVPTLYGAILANSTYDKSTGSPRLRLCVSTGEALPEGLGRA